MARASNVYIPVEVDHDGDHILAAFTVKHECQTWLQRHPRTGLSRDVVRVPDGLWRTTGEARWSEEDFLNG